MTLQREAVEPTRLDTILAGLAEGANEKGLSDENKAILAGFRADEEAREEGFADAADKAKAEEAAAEKEAADKAKAEQKAKAAAARKAAKAKAEEAKETATD
jgi:hypothetical protein